MITLIERENTQESKRDEKETGEFRQQFKVWERIGRVYIQLKVGVLGMAKRIVGYDVWLTNWVLIIGTDIKND